MALEIRTARDDEREQLHKIGMQAFASRAVAFDAEADRARVPLERRLVADADGEIAGKLSAWELGQWFGGRRVPMGGVAGVAVRPQFRGRGVASRLLTATVCEMRDRGEVIASLFPMNHTLYRRMGWQSAGRYPVHEVPARALLDLPSPVTQVDVREAAEADLPRLRELHDTMSRREQGNLWFGPEFAAQRLGPRTGGSADAFVAMIDGTVSGYVAIDKEAPRDDGEFYSLVIESMVAADRDTELQLWRLVSAYHPVARSVRFVAPPERTLLHALGEREIQPAPVNFVWMTRLVDAAGAIAARGYPEHVKAELHLRITDDLAPWNAGPFVLRVHDGEGALEPGGVGAVHVANGDLAALYTGWSSPHQLAAWGMLDGATPDDMAALERIFGGSTPWMRDFF